MQNVKKICMFSLYVRIKDKGNRRDVNKGAKGRGNPTRWTRIPRCPPRKRGTAAGGKAGRRGIPHEVGKKKGQGLTLIPLETPLDRLNAVPLISRPTTQNQPGWRPNGWLNEVRDNPGGRVEAQKKNLHAAGGMRKRRMIIRVEGSVTKKVGKRPLWLSAHAPIDPKTESSKRPHRPALKGGDRCTITKTTKKNMHVRKCVSPFRRRRPGRRGGRCVTSHKKNINERKNGLGFLPHDRSRSPIHGKG